MCLAVPGELVQRDSADAAMAYGVVEFAGVRRRVCLACVPEAAVGDYVLVHAGVAISTVDPVEARRLFESLKELNEIEVGEEQTDRPVQPDHVKEGA